MSFCLLNKSGNNFYCITIAVSLSQPYRSPIALTHGIKKNNSSLLRTYCCLSFQEIYLCRDESYVTQHFLFASLAIERAYSFHKHDRQCTKILSECNDCIMNHIKRKQRAQFSRQHVLRMISVRRGITRGRALGIDQTVSSLWQHYPWCLIPQYHNQCRYSVRGNWCFTYMYNDKRKCPGVSKTISTQLHLEFCYWLKILAFDCLLSFMCQTIRVFWAKFGQAVYLFPQAKYPEK